MHFYILQFQNGIYCIILYLCQKFVAQGSAAVFFQQKLLNITEIFMLTKYGLSRSWQRFSFFFFFAFISEGFGNPIDLKFVSQQLKSFTWHNVHIFFFD